MTCEHTDFDEYFGTCPDCGASRTDVLHESFLNELQAVYAKMQDALGIDGDITPEQQNALEQVQNQHATIVAEWLNSSFEA
jgi:hypothetical protein